MQLRLVDTFTEADDSVITFVWEPDEPTTWVAGQFLRYTLPHDNADDRGTTRWFTIAAPPYEGKPRITTRFAGDSGSTFKAKLRTLSLGDTIEATRPAGDFVFNTTRPAILVAGGIGITPYRAMLLQLDHERIKFRVHLLYANRTSQYVFRDQFEAIAAKLSSFKVTYFTDPKHIELEDIKQASAELVNPLYYLSGPELMVEHYKELLTQAGVGEGDIKTDYFPGYKRI